MPRLPLTKKEEKLLRKYYDTGDKADSFTRQILSRLRHFDLIALRRQSMLIEDVVLRLRKEERKE